MNTDIATGRSKGDINDKLKAARDDGIITPEEYREMKEIFVPKGITY